MAKQVRSWSLCVFLTSAVSCNLLACSRTIADLGSCDIQQSSSGPHYSTGIPTGLGDAVTDSGLTALTSSAFRIIDEELVTCPGGGWDSSTLSFTAIPK